MRSYSSYSLYEYSGKVQNGKIRTRNGLPPGERRFAVTHVSSKREVINYSFYQTTDTDNVVGEGDILCLGIARPTEILIGGAFEKGAIYEHLMNFSSNDTDPLKIMAAGMRLIVDDNIHYKGVTRVATLGWENGDFIRRPVTWNDESLDYLRLTFVSKEIKENLYDICPKCNLIHGDKGCLV